MLGYDYEPASCAPLPMIVGRKLASFPAAAFLSITAKVASLLLRERRADTQFIFAG